jgi:hypothetical protein
MNVRTARYVARYGEEADEALERAQAAATLLEGFRSVGMVLDADTVTQGQRVPVYIDEDGDYRPVEDGLANGFYVDWTATGTPRLTDVDDPVLLVDADGWATVPEPIATMGGSVRVRHDYGGEVTVHAFDPDDTGTGYLLAQELDPDLVHVELLGGTARLHVTLDDQ